MGKDFTVCDNKCGRERGMETFSLIRWASAVLCFEAEKSRGVQAYPGAAPVSP